MERIYNKLVRDRIPEIISNKGEQPITHILNDEEYKKELEAKLLEEYKEVLETTNSTERIEELADMIEIIKALASLEDKTIEYVLEVAEQKAQKRGGFKDKIFLEKVISDND